jgi:potassium-transporting ATPase potassium-binding subunit
VPVSLQTIATWAVVFAAFAVTAKPLGAYMARVFSGQPTVLDRPFAPIEGAILRVAGVDASVSMTAVQYGAAFVGVNLLWMLFSYTFLRLQGILPFNPEHFGAVNPYLAFNTSASFTTNTNWQAYSGENTLSYFSQFANLSYLQFVTPASGACVGVAYIRALAGRPLGNFWSDLIKVCTRVLLPLSVIVALLLVAQGVPETLAAYLKVHTLAGGTQLVPRGPIASWEAIEHLGENGGGYTNANSANPLENTTAITNMILILCMGLVPVAFFPMFGIMTGRPKTAWTLFGVAAAFFLVMLAMIYFPEHLGNPILNALHLHGTTNMEGKEVRFGIGGTTLFETGTMAFTTGSVASAHDSYLPLAQLSFFLGMFLNLVFGGKGVGLLNMLMLVILTVFLAGLMVGRTPEFFGKKIEAREVSLTAVAFLLHPFLILVGGALSVATPAGLAGVFNNPPQGLSEILYGVSSAAANNGSALGGLGADLPFYEVLLGIIVILARYASVMAMLLVGASLLAKKATPESKGTMKSHGLLFGTVVFASILILNALTFFPIMALGPIAQHYMLAAVHTF